MQIEQLIIDHLKTKLSTDYVYAETPEAVPVKFVLISVVDRGRTNFIDRVTVEFYSHAESKAEASELNDMVMEAVWSLPEHNEISGVRLGGGDSEPDVWLELYRYRSTYNIVFYGD